MWLSIIRAKAAEIAVRTVKDYVDDGSALERIVFDVFTSEDEPIYHPLPG